MGEPYSLAVAAGAGVMTSLVKAGTVPAKHFVGKHRQWDTFKDIEDNLSSGKNMRKIHTIWYVIIPCPKMV